MRGDHRARAAGAADAVIITVTSRAVACAASASACAARPARAQAAGGMARFQTPLGRDGSVIPLWSAHFLSGSALA